MVPTRNRAEYLPELLAALDAQTHPNIEIVLVDDASEDETSRLLAAWQGINHVVVRLERSAGSYVARNYGWRTASHELIAFTDDDCLPHPQWIEALDSSLTRSQVVGVQGVTLARPGRITPFTHQIEQRRGGPPYRTCNILYRRSILERLNGFEPMRWYADNIFGLRALQVGEICFAPNAIVFHPPRPREWRDRSHWLARFQADAVHRRELRRLGAERVPIPGTALPVLLWVARPVLKQAWNHARYAILHPVAYATSVPPMIREKHELWRALRAQRSSKRTGGESATENWAPIPDEPLVSVVIVTKQRDALLASALTSIDLQTWNHWQLVVVDHADAKSTQTLSLAHNATYIPASGSTLSAARQAGVDASQGDIVAFLDDDCQATPNWLRACVQAFRDRPELAGVQGQTNTDAGAIGSHTIRVSGPTPLYQTCNIAYRRAALLRAGGFDTRFIGWFEDAALAARVLNHGPIGFSEAAVVTHAPRARRRRTRSEWRLVLRDEQLLARAYGRFYRRTRGPGFLPVVILRWLLGSPVKTLARELPSAHTDVFGYCRLSWLLVRERVSLLGALFDVLVQPTSHRN